jgi:peptidoglycan/LPS O-acetylase OafA/YrhL
MKKEVVYFPGLNGIRAIAAILVVIFHTDQWSHYFGLESIGFWKTEMHSYAVVLFFVLSGFLITYLLLKEKIKTGDISYRNFYIRRILRIWPVYYLVLFTGTFLLIVFQFWTPRDLSAIFLVHLFLVPNLFFDFGFKAELIGVLWSVGVEEQFYAFWPFLVNKSKRVIRTLLIFIGVYLVVKGIVVSFQGPIKMEAHFDMIPFDNMAIGGVAAWLYATRSRLLRFIYHPVTQVLCWGFLLVSIFYAPVEIPYLNIYTRSLHATMYAMLILNVSTNPKNLVSLENIVFNFLGKISYGIYAYHFITLFLVSLLLKPMLSLLAERWEREFVMFASVLSVTILVSYLSYHYFESWFLRMKDKYMIVKTRAEGADQFKTTNIVIGRASSPLVRIRI